MSEPSRVSKNGARNLGWQIKFLSPEQTLYLGGKKVLFFPSCLKNQWTHSSFFSFRILPPSSFKDLICTVRLWLSHIHTLYLKHSCNLNINFDDSKQLKLETVLVVFFSLFVFKIKSHCLNVCFTLWIFSVFAFLTPGVFKSTGSWLMMPGELNAFVRSSNEGFFEGKREEKKWLWKQISRYGGWREEKGFCEAKVPRIYLQYVAKIIQNFYVFIVMNNSYESPNIKLHKATTYCSWIKVQSFTGLFLHT